MSPPVINASRTPAHQRNPGLEELLQGLNADLAQITCDRTAVPHRPTLFLVGCARSGTTLALQWLSRLGAFAYPTNFISRFPAAPWVGARVQRMLTDPDCDFRGELTLDRPADPAPYTSHLGKTKGLLAPHEFWYWWRRFLPAAETHFLTDAQLETIDARGMAAELAAWQDVDDRPLVLKALIMNGNLPWLAAAVPGSIFVHVTRDPLLNSQSLLEARREFHGDTSAWYSFRPAQYAALRDLPPAEQVAGQIHVTETAIRDGLASIAPERQLTVAYEDLCADPRTVYGRLQEIMTAQGWALPAAYQGPASFPVSCEWRLDSDETAALEQAWRAYPDHG